MHGIRVSFACTLINQLGEVDMTKAIKHTVPGAKGERRSPRVYTHAIIASIDWDARRKSDAARAEEGMKDWFKYQTEVANLVVGALRYPNERPGSHLADVKVEKKEVEEAKAWLAKNPTLAIAIVNAVAKADGYIAEALKKAGGRDTVHVLAWSQSAGNAAKAVSKFVGSDWTHYVDVRVVETVRHDVLKGAKS
jgi:hypothetical protein